MISALSTNTCVYIYDIILLQGKNSRHKHKYNRHCDSAVEGLNITHIGDESFQRTTAI